MWVIEAGCEVCVESCARSPKLVTNDIQNSILTYLNSFSAAFFRAHSAHAPVTPLSGDRRTAIYILEYGVYYITIVV